MVVRRKNILSRWIDIIGQKSNFFLPMIGNTVRYDGISRLLSAMASVLHYLRILKATWSPRLLVAGYGGLSLGRLLVVAPSCPPILGTCCSK